jgi:hypothetical protein
VDALPVECIVVRIVQQVNDFKPGLAALKVVPERGQVELQRWSVCCCLCSGGWEYHILHFINQDSFT